MTESCSNLSMIDCGIRSLIDVPLRLTVTSINLHSNSIAKIENIHFLQSLVHLDLSSNQIKQIEGLQGLVSLRTLNLSCNLISVVENLSGLKQLNMLNLSYNKLQHINGLSDLWGSAYSIETILLNGNFLGSVEELTYYLSGLVHLKQLALSENKFVNMSDYKVAVFAASKSLVLLDGRDRQGKPAKIKPHLASNLNGFEEFIEWNEPAQAKPKFDSNYPKIAQHMESKKKAVFQFSGQSTNLDVIEDKIHKLLSLRNRIKTSKERGSLSSGSETEEDNYLDLSSSSAPNLKSSRLLNKPKSAKKGILKPTISHEVVISKPEQQVSL